jgi:hypothetical protein
MNALKEKLKNYLKVFKKKIPKRDSNLRHIPWKAHLIIYIYQHIDHSATVTDNYREIKDRIQQT